MATSDLYSHLAFVTLKSLFINNVSIDEIVVFFIGDNLEEQSKTDLINLVQAYQREIVFIDLPEEYSNYIGSNRNGKTVFSYAEKLEDYPAHKYGLVGYPGVEPQNLPAKYQYGKEVQPKSADLLKEIKIKADAVGVTNSNKNPRTHMGKGNEIQVYAEDVLVGYRYFETMKQKVVFPFGYGLSYTTFAYSDAKIADNGNKTWTVTVSVKNTGKCAGKEVVQLYVGDDKASVVRPVKELKGFEKILLQPGEQKTKFFDETKHEWVAEPGTFKAYIGSSSKDIKAKLPFKL